MIPGDEIQHMLHDFMHDGLKKIPQQAIDQNDVRLTDPIIIKMMSNKHDDNTHGHVEIPLNHKHDPVQSNAVLPFSQKKFHDVDEIQAILHNPPQTSSTRSVHQH